MVRQSTNFCSFSAQVSTHDSIVPSTRTSTVVPKVTVAVEIFSRMIAQSLEEFKFHPIEIHAGAVVICKRAMRDWAHAVTRATASIEGSGRTV